MGLPLENTDKFDMGRPQELVHRRDPLQPEPGVNQHPRVPRKGLGIARHPDHDGGLGPGDLVLAAGQGGQAEGGCQATEGDNNCTHTVAPLVVF